MNRKSTQIMIVEDESSIRDNIRLALLGEGFSITECSTAKSALEFLKMQNFDLLILDVGLPDESGFELCKKIRIQTQVPLLFLTARNQEVDKIVGFELGADDYLTKPFSPRELVVRIRAILKRSQRSIQSNPNSEEFKNAFEKNVIVGPFEIEPSKLRIRFCDKPLELSRYEFKILEVLLKKPGVVFSRQKLMDMVWEDPEMSLERTVDAHIKTIRAKLKEVNPEMLVIETHRGTGYSLREDFE